MASPAAKRPLSLLDLITLVDNTPLDFATNHAPYYRLLLAPDPRPHGYLHPQTVSRMPWPPSFTVSHERRAVTLGACPTSSDAASQQAIDAAHDADAASQQAIDAAIDADAASQQAIDAAIDADAASQQAIDAAIDADAASQQAIDAAIDADAASQQAIDAAHANAAFQQAIDAAIDGDVFPSLHGLHSEPFRIMGARGGPVRIERFAASLFGIATRGAHLTCYVRADDGDAPPLIWVARRSARLVSHPGLLDSTVAGGVRADDSPLGCVLAEAAEEASLPAAFVAQNVRGVGAVTLANTHPVTGLHHSEVLYVYDLELPRGGGIVPRPADGEVDEFLLMGCGEVRERMLNGEFKPNVCPVLIDFLVRHGVVTPEGEGEGAYVDICQRLRRRLPVVTGGGG